ncbi:hypothetical protein [Caldanaerobacter sp.]|uniref:hypothetical protein n=1 Tax=Caldanaerobacter sp. TaxID=2930036 RepID=UPI003C710CB0
MRCSFNENNKDHKTIECALGLQSFSIFLLLMLSGMLSPPLAVVIPLSINLVSSVFGTFALFQNYKEEGELFYIILSYYILLVLFYSLVPYYRGAFDLASDILPIPKDALSTFHPITYPEP